MDSIWIYIATFSSISSCDSAAWIQEEQAEEAEALALEVEVHLEAEEVRLDQHLEDIQLVYPVHRL